MDNGFQTALSPEVPFDLGAAVASVTVQSDGNVLIGGYFTAVNGVSRNGIARLKADGSLDSRFITELSLFNSDVSAVALQSDGKVLIAGRFTTVNGMERDGIARLWGNADIPPAIKSITRRGANANLSWYAISNRTYRVQYTGDLSANAWTDLAVDVSATGATASKTDATVVDASQRFYRVVLLP